MYPTLLNDYFSARCTRPKLENIFVYIPNRKYFAMQKDVAYVQMLAVL